jgi:hypothetical protein
MTYNFDPDRWYDDQLRRLEWQRQRGGLDEAAFDEAARELERRHEEMLKRMDGIYQLPRQDGSPKTHP